MTEISITRTIHEYFDDIGDTEIRQNIIMYMSDKTYEVYKKYIKKHILNNENIDPVIFISQTIKIVDNSMSKNKNKSIKIIDDTQQTKQRLVCGAHHKISKNFIGCKVELSGLCDFISKIYIDIYKFLGYENYEENLWELKIKRNVKK